MEVSVPTPEELATEVASTPTPTPDHTYSTMACPSMPNLATIYSTTTTTSPVPSNLVPICDAMTDILRYALHQGPHTALLMQQPSLVQLMISVQGSISTPMVSTTPSFDVHLELADEEFLKRKTGECKEKQKNVLFSEGKVNPYIKIVAAFEQSLRESTGTALTQPLRTQLQADRDKPLSPVTRKVMVPKFLGLLSPTLEQGVPQL